MGIDSCARTVRIRSAMSRTQRRSSGVFSTRTLPGFEDDEAVGLEASRVFLDQQEVNAELHAAAVIDAGRRFPFLGEADATVADDAVGAASEAVALGVQRPAVELERLSGVESLPLPDAAGQ